jgi:purine nucleosidase
VSSSRKDGLTSQGATTEKHSRRSFLGVAGGTLALAVGAHTLSAAVPAPRQRIIIDNDFAADPDGLYQTAHHLLSPSVDVRFLIGSHSHAGENWADGPITTQKHAAKAQQLLDLIGLPVKPRILAGTSEALPVSGAPTPSATSEAIIAEAMRNAAETPLYYASGAGLTELANAWLLEPRIGKGIRLLWIGGSEYPGAPLPPGPREEEYNLTIDVRAAQVIFNRSDIDIWQVPRNAYRKMLIGWAELETRSRRAGPLGGFLADQVANVRRFLAGAPPRVGVNPGESYVLGDSPLVTLTALQSPFQPDPSSSSYELRSRPLIDDSGRYKESSSAKPIRVYRRIDARLTFEDMFAKLDAAIAGKSAQ